MKTIALSLTLAVGWLVANAAIAAEPCKAPAACTEVQTCGGEGCCGCCGCACQCEKHCRVVCEMKEVKKTVWVVKCEDFCDPRPNFGGRCCGHCGECNGCSAEATCCGDECGNKCDPCAVERNKCLVPPKCGKVRTRKILEKKEVVCTVPCYKCVVVYCCPNCGSNGCDEQTAPAPTQPVAPPPAPPKATDTVVLPQVATLSFVD